MAENRIELLKNMVAQNPGDSFARYAGEALKERLMGYYLERYSPIGAFESSRVGLTAIQPWLATR